MIARIASSLAVFFTLTTGAMAETKYTLLDFSELSGWADDDHSVALSVFSETCSDISDPDWKALCPIAASATDARDFFERFFVPVLIEDGSPMVFTGYFEPELQGSSVQTSRFRFPIYSKPNEVTDGPWLTRRQIEEDQVLEGRGLELAWLDDPVDVFFLQVQGSGRIKLQDGRSIRVGFGGKNGHEYSSIGRELVRRGVYTEHQVSAQVIQNWVRNNPNDGQELLWVNDSFVFFREVSEVPSDKGPLGAMNRSITAMRSIAVDPAYTILGAPVWIEKDGSSPLRRLMIAQDTGSAIKGAQRADIFVGTGSKAGREAGTLNDSGRMIVFMPIQRAYALLPETVL